MNEKPHFADLRLVSTLMQGVRDAIPVGGDERHVVTYISRPMWRKWCEDLGLVKIEHKDKKVHFVYPDPSLGWGPTNARVYGSLTIIVESEHYFAISRAITETT